MVTGFTTYYLVLLHTNLKIESYLIAQLKHMSTISRKRQGLLRGLGV